MALHLKTGILVVNDFSLDFLPGFCAASDPQEKSKNDQRSYTEREMLGGFWLVNGASSRHCALVSANYRREQ